MSIKRMISINIPIQEAMEDMGLYDDRLRPLFTRWAMDAERRIGSFYSYKRDYVVAERCDANHYDIPCHVVGVMGLIFGKVDQTNCRKYFREQYQYAANYGSTFPFANNFILNSNGVVMSYSDPSWEIQNDQIIFMNPQDATEVTLDCIIYQIDDNGFPLINENHRNAISQYLKKMKTERGIFAPGESAPAPGVLPYLDAEWHRLCAQARGDDGFPNATEEAEVSLMYNDHLSGAKGIVWRYRDEFYWLGQRSR